MIVKDLYYNALSKRCAIGAFNFSNLDVLNAIINVSEKLNCPILACVSEGAFKYLGEFLEGIVKSVKQKHKNVFFHLDHGKSLDMVKCAIQIGFESVMIDGSSLTFEKNVELTKSVAEYAHGFNVQVEGELGVLKGIEDEVSSSQSIYSNPDQCLEFVNRTGVDSLAVAIGTSHGAYKFNHVAKLNYELLSEIQNRLGNYPLVLHGASSVNSQDVELFNFYNGDLKNAKGVDEEILNYVATKTNIVKINTDTDLRICYLANLKKSIAQKPDELDMRVHSKFAISCLERKIEGKLKTFGF